MKIPMSRHQLALSLTAVLSPCKEFIQHSHVTPFLQYLKVRVRKGIRAQFRKDFQNLGSQRSFVKIKSAATREAAIRCEHLEAPGKLKKKEASSVRVG